MLRKLTAVLAVLLTFSTTLIWATDDGAALQSEQQSRMQAIKQHAQAGTLTIGDMHEAGAHLRIVAARSRDDGTQSKADAYIKNTANTTKLINMCMASGRAGVTQASCQSAIALIRTNGSNTMLQAVASVAYNGNQWGNFIPTGYQGGARYVPVILPNCVGVHQAIDVGVIISGVFGLFPGGQAAAGIGALFCGFLLLAADSFC